MEFDVDEPESDLDLEIESECSQDCPLRSYDTTLYTAPLSTCYHIIDDSIKIADSSEIYREVKGLQTRILRLKRGKLNSQLVGYLIYVDLNPDYFAVDTAGHRIEYLALSYAWGSRDRAHYMRLNGRLFPITWNLWVALQRLRSDSEDRQLWIDALCIDQSSNGEMSRQVATMSLIYRCAAQTVAWLGDTGHHTDLAIRYLHKVRIPTNIESFKSCHSAQCEHAFPALAEGVQNLYTRPWLGRIWIRREVWASSKIVVACGESRISWQGFVRGYAVCARSLPIKANARNLESLAKLGGSKIDMNIMSDLHRRLTKGAIDNAFTISQSSPSNSRLSRDGYWREMPDILRVLNEAVGCESSDQRDRVYALLDMVDDSETGNFSSPECVLPRLEVDYSKCTSVVYADVARHTMRSQRRPFILCMQGVFGANSDLNLASWTPDWRYKLTDPFREMQAELDRILPYPSRWSFVDSCEAFEGEGDTLICDGYSVGVVDKTANEDFLRNAATAMNTKSSKTALVDYTMAIQDALDVHASEINEELSQGQRGEIQIDGLSVAGTATTNMAGLGPFFRGSFYPPSARHSLGPTPVAKVQNINKWMVPMDAKRGDGLIVLEGSVIPLIIRKSGRAGEFQWVGPAILEDEAWWRITNRSAFLGFFQRSLHEVLLRALEVRGRDCLERFTFV